MLNLNPQTTNVQALDGRFISTLSPVETAVLDYYHTHGRKCGVSVAIINQADPEKLAVARVPADAAAILRRADCRVNVNIGRFTIPKQPADLVGTLHRFPQFPAD